MSKSNHTRRGVVARQRRRDAAEQRLQISESQNPTERLEVLDERLGQNVGAENERRRLAASLVITPKPHRPPHRKNRGKKARRGQQ